MLKTSEAKQALLLEKEAAHSRHVHQHQHHHQHSAQHKTKPHTGIKDGLQPQQQRDHLLDLGGEGAGVDKDGPHTTAAAAVAVAGGGGLVSSPGQKRLSLTSRKRRHSSSAGVAGAAGAAAAAAGSAPVNAATAPPLRKEPVGKEEAVGLLQALMKQRKGG